ncbi:Hypothetical_protein [Hexamita inflata]|uniref:Hypothetical_protein n=1 Tax=Hexamita inflata TaxID=28002 RepID=A0AA86U180_9EUKA|nr:Hypothetical protein HINF_LOCUS25710 [Hexamita inflata]
MKPELYEVVVLLEDDKFISSTLVSKIQVDELYKYDTIPEVLTQLRQGPEAEIQDQYTLVYYIIVVKLCVSPITPPDKDQQTVLKETVEIFCTKHILIVTLPYVSAIKPPEYEEVNVLEQLIKEESINIYYRSPLFNYAQIVPT